MRWPWSKAESDLDLEMRHHLETLADSYERQGFSRRAAMERARAEFGGVEQIKESCRDESVWNWVTPIGQDLRFGWRMMRKTPAITVAAILSLALGIGAATAILTMADTLLWRALPVPAAEQLVEIQWQSMKRPDIIRGSSGSGYREGAIQVADYFNNAGYQSMRQSLGGKIEVAAHTGSQLVSTNFRGNVVVARLRGVTENFFQVLQLNPFAGQLFDAANGATGSPLVMAVTHRYWVQHLGADPGVIGQPIRVNNRAYTLRGILPKSFTGIVPGEETDLYTPLEQSPAFLERDGFFREGMANRRSWFLQLLGRKTTKIEDRELASLMDVPFAAGWERQPKSTEATPHIRVVNATNGLGSIRRRFGDPVTILLSLVGIVLVVACANIANLLLARAAAREKEVALRVSLGCRSGRLMRQFFTESLMLAVLGGTLSIAVALGLGRLMVGLLARGPDGMVLSVAPDVRSLAGTAIVTLLTALLFGLYPAWRASRVDASPALKEGAGSGGTASRSRWVPAKILVLVQVALGVLLVTAAILFTSNLNEVVSRDTGFDRSHLLLFDIRPGEVGYGGDRLAQFYHNLEERLAALPGVQSAGLAVTRPMKGGGYWDSFRSVASGKELNNIAVHHANAAFLSTLGVSIIAGRGMTRQEARTGAKVVVLSENAIKALELSAPLGTLVAASGVNYEIIGIARQARYAQMFETPPVAYIPFDYTRDAATLILRTSIPPMAELPAVRNVMKELDANLPLVDIFTMEQQISRTLQRERMFAWLCGSFGVLALVLCIVGLYGLMSHTTARRIPEIGIRLAMGASPSNVMNQVMWEGMRLALAGLVLGLPLALYMVRIAEKQKYLPAGDVPYWTMAAAIGTLALAALAAVFSPARRASSVDPMTALRQG